MKQDSFLTKHLHDAHESYFEHLLFTLRFAATMVVISIVAVIHGVLPFLCTHTASGMLCKLMDEVKARKAMCEARGNCKSADNS